MEEQNKIKKVVPTVQTFTEDMVKVIEDDKEGLIKKIIKEQEVSEIHKKNTSPQSKKNRLFLAVSIVFIILTVAILAFLFFRKQNQTVDVVNPNAQFSPIIFTDKMELVEISGLTKDKIVGNILREANDGDGKAGSIEAIYLTEGKNPIGLRRFFDLIKANFSPGEANAVADDFLLGFVNGGVKDINRTPENLKSGGFFLLLKVRSFVDIFNSMRLWESKMFSDLHGLLGMDSSSFSTYLLTKGFEDGIVENKNARIIYDEYGDIALMYVFANEQSLIITTNRSVVREVMLRLSGSQIKK